MKIVYLCDQETDEIVGGVAEGRRLTLGAVHGLMSFKLGLLDATGAQKAKRHFNIRRNNRFYLDRQFFIPGN